MLDAPVTYDAPSMIELLPSSADWLIGASGSSKRDEDVVEDVWEVDRIECCTLPAL